LSPAHGTGAQTVVCFLFHPKQTRAVYRMGLPPKKAEAHCDGIIGAATVGDGEEEGAEEAECLGMGTRNNRTKNSNTRPTTTPVRNRLLSRGLNSNKKEAGDHINPHMNPNTSSGMVPSGTFRVNKLSGRLSLLLLSRPPNEGRARDSGADTGSRHVEGIGFFGGAGACTSDMATCMYGESSIL